MKIPHSFKLLVSILFLFVSLPAYATSFKLRVLTYNIHGMVILPIDHSRYQKIGQILAQKRARGEAPHIVAIQESFHEKTHELLAAAGYPHDRFGPIGGTVKLSSGLAIYSDFPIVDTQVGVYKACAGIDCMARKGWMKSLVQIPGAPTPIEIWNSHLQAGYKQGLAEYKKARIQRLKQVEEVTANVGMERSLAALFLGDLNFNFYSPEYKRFIESTPFQGVFAVCAMSQDCLMRDKSAPVWTRAIDHQFYSQGRIQVTPLEVKRVFTNEEGLELSDHEGVETIYNLEF